VSFSKAGGLRPSLASHEEIAQAAYRIWEQEGYPEGRDKEHWYRAVAELERGAGEILAGKPSC
jgi:hypothetical protein